MKKLGGLITAMFLMISNADALEVGVGVKAGTVGAGVDLSVALTQTIKARISVTSILAAEDDINTELEQLKAWPVISIGLNYAF